MMAGVDWCDAVAAAEAVARQALDRAAIHQPPVDALRLARALGIEVARDCSQSGRARYVRLRCAPSILLADDPRPERRQWALAHELGEHLACEALHAVDCHVSADNPSAREQMANLIASRLLLPGEWFRADGRDCHWDLLELKQRYATASHELIARRMLDEPSPVVITIVDQESIYLRRSNLDGRVPAMSPAERRCWYAAHADGRAAAIDDGFGQPVVRCWPVHEPNWKREILRTEVMEP